MEAQVGCNNLLVANFNPLRESSFIRPTEIEKGFAFSLCLLSWNCHLTTGYFDLLQLNENSPSKFDVVGLCGTFSKSDQSLSAYFFPGYDFEVRKRTSMKCGEWDF